MSHTNKPMDLDQELDRTIDDFAELQAELNLRQAQDTLRELVANLDLTTQERAGLEAEIGGLQEMLDKLEGSRISIAVFGMVGRGKSSVLNALVGESVFETGPLHGVTRSHERVNWQISGEKLPGGESELFRLELPKIGDIHIELIDTPGIDEVNGETREILAKEVAKQADLLLFVIAGDLTRIEYEALSHLREAGKPMLLVFNKIDQYPDADRTAIYEKIRDDRVKELLSPDEIVMVAAAPLVAKAVKRSDGTMSAQILRGEPQVDDLKLKILQVLQNEGKSLVAINSMLFAGDINEILVKRKMEIREQGANQIIWNGVRVKALAIALNPVTVIDIVSGAAIDVTIILTLSKLYGIPMTQDSAIELLQKIALGMGGIAASELVVNFGLSSLKGLLGLAAPVTGGISLIPYLSVAVTQAGVAGFSSYAIGQVTKAYLANGASWGDEGPKALVTKILASLDEDSILSRIKAELQAKLKLSKLGD